MTADTNAKIEEFIRRNSHRTLKEVDLVSFIDEIMLMEKQVFQTEIKRLEELCAKMENDLDMLDI